MCSSCDPKNFVFNFKMLVMTTVTSMGYDVNTKIENLRVIEVLVGNGWYNMVACHKRISNTDILVLG